VFLTSRILMPEDGPHDCNT